MNTNFSTANEFRIRHGIAAVHTLTAMASRGELKISRHPDDDGKPNARKIIFKHEEAVWLARIAASDAPKHGRPPVAKRVLDAARVVSDLPGFLAILAEQGASDEVREYVARRWKTLEWEWSRKGGGAFRKLLARDPKTFRSDWSGRKNFPKWTWRYIGEIEPPPDRLPVRVSQVRAFAAMAAKGMRTEGEPADFVDGLDNEDGARVVAKRWFRSTEKGDAATKFLRTVEPTAAAGWLPAPEQPLLNGCRIGGATDGWERIELPPVPHPKIAGRMVPLALLRSPEVRPIWQGRPKRADIDHATGLYIHEIVAAR